MLISGFPNINSYAPANLGPKSLPINKFAPPALSHLGGTFTPHWNANTLKTEFASPAGFPLTQYILNNGHRILIEQRPTQIVSVRTFINKGSILENSIYPSSLYINIGFPSGIAHLDEHCRIMSSQNYPLKNSWRRAVDSFGTRFNAHTADEYIDHDLTFNYEDLPNLLRLHTESVLRPLYNARDIEQEKAAVLNESTDKNRLPQIQFENKLYELVFDRPGNQTGGKREDVVTTTPAQLALFYKMVYQPENMVTVVSGNANPEQVLQILGPEFGYNSARVSIPHNESLRMALVPGQIRTAVMSHPDINTVEIRIGFPAPPSNAYKERMAMEILHEILSGDETSLLNKNIVQQQQIANYAVSAYSPFRQVGLTKFFIQTEVGQEQLAFKAVLKEIASFSQGMVSATALAEAQENLIHKFKRKQQKVDEVAKQIGIESINKSLPYYLNYMQLARQITPLDILQVAQKYLNLSTYAAVFGYPGNKTTSRVGSGC